MIKMRPLKVGTRSVASAGGSFPYDGLKLGLEDDFSDETDSDNEMSTNSKETAMRS
jgi:hypothetical protein